MGLLAELVRNIISKLISWLKSSEKSLKTLLGYIKEAIATFLKNLKKNLLTAGKTLSSTVLSAIFGPIVSAVQKIWTMLKQGGKSVKEAIDYVKSPENRKQPHGVLMLEVGKIIMTGLTGIGALVLGETIEKALLPLPPFGVQIPMLGSLANIIGIFLGAVVAGIAGALVLHMIDKLIAKKKKQELRSQKIETQNEIYAKQRELIEVYDAHLDSKKNDLYVDITSRHEEAATIMKEAYKSIEESLDTSTEEELSNLIRNTLKK